MTAEQITDIINTADGLTATLNNNAAELPATINGDATLAESLRRRRRCPRPTVKSRASAARMATGGRAAANSRRRTGS
jgi:hypothetical protein